MDFAVAKEQATCMTDKLYVGPATKDVEPHAGGEEKRLPWGADGAVEESGAVSDWNEINANRDRITEDFNQKCPLANEAGMPRAAEEPLPQAALFAVAQDGFSGASDMGEAMIKIDASDEALRQRHRPLRRQHAGQAGRVPRTPRAKRMRKDDLVASDRRIYRPDVRGRDPD